VLRVDVSRWDQRAADLRDLALHADHPRSRERFLALHEVAQGGCATEIATRSGRHPQTVMGWVPAYNDHGPAALLYRRSGGRPPFARGSRRRSAKRSALPSRLRASRP
jgi:transposase